jgi:hypothetical protein
MEGDKKKQGYGGRQKEARLWRETKRSKTMEGDKKKQDYGGRQKEARLWRETKRIYRVVINKN